MEFIRAGMIVFLGSIVQGAVGFSYGLISVPLLTWAGFKLSEAAALTAITSGIQVSISVYKLREHIPFQEIKLGATIRYLTLPLGILLLFQIENLEQSQVKHVIGLFVLIAVLIRVFAKIKPMEHIPLGISIATFGVSGIMQGAVSMGGPPIILWVTARDFTSQTARAFTLSLFLLGAPIHILLLYWLSDNITVATIMMAVALSPIIFLGSTTGIRIGNQFSKEILNGIAITLLFLIAISAMFS